MPCRIVMLLSNSFRPDPRVLKEAESLSALGYQVTLLAWDRSSEMKPEEAVGPGVRLLRIQSVRSTYGMGARQILHLPRFWVSAIRLLHRLHPDLVHCHDFDTLPAGLLWSKINRKPVIYDAHEYYAQLCQPRLHGLLGRFLYRFIDLAEKMGARSATAVVTVDERLGDVYRRISCPVTLVGHYPNRLFAQEPNPVFSRSRLTLIYVGRLSIDRGLLIYVNLLGALKEKGVPARLRLAGTFTSSEEEQQVHHATRRFGEDIEFLGWIPYPKIFSLLREADLGLALLQPVPRYLLALPVKLFEYMAAGLPVLVSNFAPIQEMLKEVPCGVSINPHDGEDALRHILSWWTQPGEARTYGETGRQAILQRYHWDKAFEPLGRLYHSLLH